VSAVPLQAAGSAPTAPAASAEPVPSRLVRARDALASEWTKLRSLRSNRWTLAVAAVVTLALTAVVAQAFAASPAGGKHAAVMDRLATSFLAYAEYLVLPVTVLSVLVFTSEYGSGLIRATFTAVPRRQAVLAAGFVLAACALAGVGAGAVIRHTAGAIAAAMTVVILLAVLCLALPAPWNLRLGRFTLPFAAYAEVTARPPGGLLSPWLSLLVLIAWPAAALLAAAVVLTRRDV
jgi:ABC-2 type transport system permease protein